MNEELQSTNEELETMNDELRERTDDTLRANAFLASVLSGMQQAVVVVDPELRVVAWSRLAQEFFGLRDDEVEGEHLLNLDIGLPVADLRDPIRSLLGGEPHDGVVVDGFNRRGQEMRYTVKLAPLHSAVGDGVDGAILLLSSERNG
jgi:two-component system CheB/CheR fusion protein